MMSFRSVVAGLLALVGLTLSAAVSAAPPAPTDLAARPGNAQVTLTWTASEAANHYEVYQGTAAGSESTTPVQGSVKGGSTVVSGLNNGTTYYFKVRGVGALLKGDYSNEAVATPIAPPVTPTGLTASAGNGQVHLTWSPSARAASYNVFQGTAAGSEGSTPVRTGITSADFIVTGLTNGTTYYFTVSAVNISGESAKSAEANAKPIAAPAAPTALKAAPGNAQVKLTWTGSSNAAGYRIFQGTSAGAEATAPVSAVTTTSALITGLTNGTVYYFKVSAYNPSGDGPKSAEVNAKPVATKPVAPIGLEAVGGNTQVILRWGAVAGATGYNVFQGTSSGGESATPVSKVASNNFTATGLTNGKTYYFKVSAFNSAGEGPRSAEINATPAAVNVAPWTTYQGNALHSGYVPITLDATKFAKKWSIQVGGSSAALQQVTEADGMVFVSQTGYFSGQGVFAINARDGSVLWSQVYPDIYSVNPPAYDNGMVYVQTVNNGGDTWLRAFDATTGNEWFQAPHGAQWENYLAPTIYDHKVYVDGGTYGGMYAFDGGSGENLWFAGLNQYDGWTPAVDAKYCYAYIGQSGLDVIDRLTGARAFTIADPNYNWNGYTMGQAPAIGSQNDALAFNGGRLLSFNLAKQTIRWTVTTGFNDQASIAKGVIYVVQNGILSARREDTGAQLWTWSTSSDTLAGAVVATDSHVFVHGSSATYAIDVNTHKPAWSYAAAGALSLSEGVLYIAGNDGYLTAVSLGAFNFGGADVELDLSHGHSGSGSPGIYDFVADMFNMGPSNATLLSLTVMIPVGFGVESLDAECSFSGRTITCNYPGVPAGQGLSAHFSLVPSQSGSYSVAAKVSATQDDPGTEDNTAVDQVIVQ